MLVSLFRIVLNIANVRRVKRIIQIKADGSIKKGENAAVLKFTVLGKLLKLNLYLVDSTKFAGDNTIN